MFKFIYISTALLFVLSYQYGSALVIPNGPHTAEEDLELLITAISVSSNDTYYLYAQIRESLTVLHGIIEAELRNIITEHLDPIPGLDTSIASAKIDEFLNKTNSYGWIIIADLTVQSDTLKALNDSLDDLNALALNTDLLETEVSQLEVSFPFYNNLIEQDFAAVELEIENLIANQSQAVQDAVNADLNTVRMDLSIQRVLLDNQQNLTLSTTLFTVNISRQYQGYFTTTPSHVSFPSSVST